MKSTIIRALATLALTAATVAPACASPHAGDVAPTFAIPSASKGTIDTAKLNGKATYLNFFATWCGPCNDEAPLVGKLYQKYHKRGLTIVGVDELEDAGKARGFAKQYHWPFAIAVDGDGKALQNFASYGLPVHVFIDRKGKISTFRLGEMEPSEIEDAIKKLL